MSAGEFVEPKAKSLGILPLDCALVGVKNANWPGPVAGKMCRLVFSVFALVQGAAAQSSSPESVALTDPVLAIHGACDECTVAVSRKQFDLLVGTLFPAGLDSKIQFGRSYADVLTFAGAAIQLGLDQSAEYQELMRWLQAKSLADLLRSRLQKESLEVPEGEIQAYYRDQSWQFEEVRLRRLVIPKSNMSATDASKFQERAHQVAIAIRERAARGEDLNPLQKECFELLGFSGMPPSTDAGNRRRSGLSPEVTEAVFGLQSGEVSLVEDEAYSFVIYKVEAKWKLPCERVRGEIVAELAKAKLKKALDSITGNVQVELNEKYFGSTSAQY